MKRNGVDKSCKELTEDEIEKLEDSSLKAITIKKFKGVFRRIAPTQYNRRAWGHALSIWLFGLHKFGYVYVVIIDPNGMENPYLIPYKEIIKLKKSVYYLEEKFRTIGDQGISTYYFHHSSSSPINMTESAYKINADNYEKLLKNAELNVKADNKILKGSRQFPAITLTMGVIIVLAIWFIYYYYTKGRFF